MEFRWVWGNTWDSWEQSNARNTLLSKMVFKYVCEHFVTPANPLAGWHNDKGAGISCVVGMVQVYKNKTATSLKTIAIVTYPVHNVPFNCSRKWRWYVFDLGHTSVGVRPVSTAKQEQHSKIDDVFKCRSVYGSNYIVLLTDELAQTLQTRGDDKIRARLEAMQNILHITSVFVETGLEICLLTSIGNAVNSLLRIVVTYRKEKIFLERDTGQRQVLAYDSSYHWMIQHVLKKEI